MTTEFRPNVNLMKVFNSQVMLINDIENAENGQILIKAGADGPPIHTHPEQEEYFTVISGEPEVYQKVSGYYLNLEKRFSLLKTRLTATVHDILKIASLNILWHRIEIFQTC